MIACKLKPPAWRRTTAYLKESFALAFPGFRLPHPYSLLLVAGIVTGMLAGLNLHWPWPFMALLFGGLSAGGITTVTYWVQRKLPNWAFAVGASTTMCGLYGFIAWAIR